MEGRREKVYHIPPHAVFILPRRFLMNSMGLDGTDGTKEQRYHPPPSGGAHPILSTLCDTFVCGLVVFFAEPLEYWMGFMYHNPPTAQ